MLIDGDVHWRSLSGDNVLSIYGQLGASCIADPGQTAQAFAWLLCERREPSDGRGAVGA